MILNSAFSRLVCTLILPIGFGTFTQAQIQSSPATSQRSGVAATWSADDATHVFGMPEIKPHKKGTLTLTTEALKFSGKGTEASIPRDSITAVSAGNERVELWGTPGRLMRMAIPNNGGLVIAAFAHHQIDMLTVEFSDRRGGGHAATFFLPKDEASLAVQRFALEHGEVEPRQDSVCNGTATEAHSILVATPNWESVDVPEAYRGLLYEHVVERIQKAKEISHLYRSGERMEQTSSCPQYTLKLSVTAFKEGSSVKRAMYGPVGMFVGTTQMVFNVELVDRMGAANFKKEVKATVRGESESTNVADKVAKSIAKDCGKTIKKSYAATILSDRPQAR